MGSNKKELLILWTSNEIDIALNMVFMYAKNSKLKEWWDEVTVLVWGPSAFLLASDTELQLSLQGLKNAGVKILACRECAENYGVEEKLEKLGIEVFYTGRLLSDWLQSDKKVLTF